MLKRDVQKFFTKLAEISPVPRTELSFINPYTLLVAVSLSAQATDKSVNKVVDVLFKTITTPQAMVALGEDKLRQAIKSIGLSNTKAKNIIAMSHQLINDFHSIVPQDLQSLMKLPGVGRKTANVILNVAFGQPTIAVDTHVFRVANRTGLAPGKTPQIVEEGLMRVVPTQYQQYAHHWLILHGRYTCKAARPLCEECPVSEYCDYYRGDKDVI